jgi:hypothetical protein
MLGKPAESPMGAEKAVLNNLCFGLIETHGMRIKDWDRKLGLASLALARESTICKCLPVVVWSLA